MPPTAPPPTPSSMLHQAFQRRCTLTDMFRRPQHVKVMHMCSHTSSAHTTALGTPGLLDSQEAPLILPDMCLCHACVLVYRSAAESVVLSGGRITGSSTEGYVQVYVRAGGPNSSPHPEGLYDVCTTPDGPAWDERNTQVGTAARVCM
jgi:hypothetical protein